MLAIRFLLLPEEQKQEFVNYRMDRMEKQAAVIRKSKRWLIPLAIVAAATLVAACLVGA